jgi:tetratricopeptide (TPR) repeat protein
VRRVLGVGLLVASASLYACKRPAPTGGATAPAPATQPPKAKSTRPVSPMDEARALYERGQLDEALARLDASGGDPDALALLGAIWVKKAESAPLPTPPPPPSPAPKHYTPPPAPEFKQEELTALGFLNKALAARAGHAQASLALADLLAPHAARRFDLDAAANRKKGAKPKTADAVAGSEEADFSIERIVSLYRAAVEGTPTSREAVDKLYAFANRVDRLDDAQWALDELLKREKEKPEPLVAYGDFLREKRKQPQQAIERYREALIWHPDDEFTLGKIADIYIEDAIDLYNKGQLAVAQARLLEAQKYVKNPNSPQGLRIRDYLSKLNSIRQPPR